MRPSTTPRLPNGGSKLKPASFVIVFPVIVATCVFPPLGVLLLAVGGMVLGVMAILRAERRRAEAREQAMVRDFHDRMNAKRMTQRWANPGWRV